MKERRPPRGLVFGVVALIGLAAPALGYAQYQEAPRPAAYALRDVTVFHADGTREAGVSLVVRRGLIAAMGVGIEIPEDAELLEGDSLSVYPGLVDAQGGVELDLPAASTAGSFPTWDPPREAQGFTPHRLAAQYLEASGPEMRGQRIAGVIATGVHPGGGMAPGQSTALLLRKSTRTPWDLVAQPSVGLLFSFQGGRRGYPSTLFAVMAQFRQMFEDATRHALVVSEYGGDPRGMTTPRWDPDLEVMAEAATGTIPVFFLADEDEEIRRVLSLAQEIGFRPILVGGEEAWQVAGELATLGVPVLVSMDFPEPREWNPPDVGGGESDEVAGGGLDPAAAREKERLEDAYSNAARLVEAGVEVALTTGGGEADLREGARKAMEYGLSQEDALRAVTSTPASLLGIPHVTTLAEGMAANFIVTDGPLFDEETAIRYTVVEGEVEVGGAPRAVRGDEAPGADLSGTWEVTIISHGMEMPFIMTLRQDGASFSGTMTNNEMPEMGSAGVTKGLISGNRVSFSLVFTQGTESMEVEGSGTVEGGVMTGSGSGEMGPFEFSAVRKPGERGGAR